MRWLLFFLSFAALAEQKSPHRIHVVPDYDDTTGYQQTAEVNIYQGSTYLNHFVEWESEDSFTLGLYFNNVPLQVGHYQQTYADDSYLGFSKWWGSKDSIRFGIASQIGTQLTGSSFHPPPTNLLAFTMAQVQWNPFRNLSISAGPWWGNPAMTTVGNYVGTAVNVGWKITPEVRVEASWYSGQTNLSGAVVNTYFSITQGAELYLGIQVPASQSGNEFAGVVGIFLPLQNSDK